MQMFLNWTNLVIECFHKSSGCQLPVRLTVLLIELFKLFIRVSAKSLPSKLHMLITYYPLVLVVTPTQVPNVIYPVNYSAALMKQLNKN